MLGSPALPLGCGGRPCLHHTTEQRLRIPRVLNRRFAPRGDCAMARGIRFWNRAVRGTPPRSGVPSERNYEMLLTRSSFALLAGLSVLAAPAFVPSASAEMSDAPAMGSQNVVMVGGAAMYPSKNIVQNAVNSK